MVSYMRDCRQDYTISPFLFILFVEILGIMIREKQAYMGGDRESFESCITVIDNLLGKIRSIDECSKGYSAVWLGSKRNWVVE